MSLIDQTTAPSSVRVSAGARSIGDALRTQARVIGAIVIRDMHTRFGGSLLSYSVAVGWPLTHLLVILGVYMIMGRDPSYGTDLLVWTVSGATPYILFFYPVRWVSQSLNVNWNLVHFPVVRPIDLLIACSALEILTGSILLIIMFALISINNGSFYIAQPVLLAEAVAASMFLGISIGVFAAPFVKLISGFAVATMLCCLLMWITGGIAFLPDSVPDPYRSYLAFNPFIHAAEWFRLGLFDDYRSETLDRGYLLSFSAVALAIGLAANRLLNR
ncbi:MAG: hypothetical protein JNL56_08610 [Alphaproteobacteria bacterium]|nr:hypothetical protein [Alphaproteobacteria bacterium]